MSRSFVPGNGPLGAAAVAGFLACSLLCAAEDPVNASAAVPKVPDAQVESNVLKALATASDLSSQPITTTTVYGVVTLSGSVQTEAMRTEAENIVSRTSGVQKVVDEMTLNGESADPQMAQNAPPATPENDSAAPQQPSPNQSGYPNYPNYPGAPEYGRQQAPPPPGYGPGDNGRPGYGAPPPYPQQQQGYGYPQQQQPYGPPPAYGQQQPPYYGAQRYPAQPAYGGQEAGKNVTIPSGALIRLRVNRALDSGRLQSGERFDGIVVNDVVADGAVAIPRGATVQGTVVDARSSGALKGRGELSLQLTSVTLGGTAYPISSDIWAHNGGDKTAQTVDNTAIGAGLGGLVGAAAAGGEGAAVGAGIGAALGLGSSAASGRGQVFIPAEGMLTFHLAQPVTVATVSQLEMDRLAQGAGPAGGTEPRLQRRYPAPYYGPVYYYPYYAYPYPYRRYPY